jgi:hypothetical protein
VTERTKHLYWWRRHMYKLGAYVLRCAAAYTAGHSAGRYAEMDAPPDAQYGHAVQHLCCGDVTLRAAGLHLISECRAGFYFARLVLLASEVRTRRTQRNKSSRNSHSQKRSTLPPLLRSRSLFLASRSRLRASFAAQYSAFARGKCPQRGHPCQKHPSTKTASRVAGK